MNKSQTVAHSDHGTVVKPHEAALIAEENGEFHLIFPDLGDDVEVPKTNQLLAAIFMKVNDDEWVSEMLQVFDEVS